VENTVQAPGLTIPYEWGTSRPTKWVRQMEDGRVAAYTADADFTKPPSILTLYAVGDYAADSPPEPLPNWYRAALMGTSAQFHSLREATAATDDWGVLADVLRHRELGDTLTDLYLLEAQTQGTNEAQEMCEHRLGGSRAYQQIRHLETLVPGAAQEPRYEQLARRGKPFNRRPNGRGRPF
jgi:hypothetical protein